MPHGLPLRVRNFAVSNFVGVNRLILILLLILPDKAITDSGLYDSVRLLFC